MPADKGLISNEEVKAIIELALTEDRVWHDVTSHLVIPEGLTGTATLIAKAEGVLAGVEVFKVVILGVDSGIRIDLKMSDGAQLKAGDVVATVSGGIRSILKAERVALNFLCHLSGVATETSRYVAQVEGLPVSIADTRKTMPGQRLLEKYAVSVGGGHNHRMHLGDGILIKDNHIAALYRSGLSLREIVSQAKHDNNTGLKLEVEVTTMAEALEAAEAGADILLLDNMKLNEIKQVVSRLKGQVRLEASGGITLENVRAVALTGVDIISIGALTHSARALDFSLELA